MQELVYSDIGLLESCNLKCQMCKMYEIKPPRKDELILLKKWEKFFDDMRKIANPGFVFNLPGGEPLLHPQIFSIIKLASNKGLKPLLSTNGYLLTRDISERLIQNGLFAVTISVDSSIPEIHDKIRGVNGTFNRLTKGIEYLDYFSKKYNLEICRFPNLD